MITDIENAVFHITFITNGTGNLEIGEALHFRFLQQFSRQVGNLFVIVSPTVQLFGSLHNVHQFLKEPLVNLCQFMYLIDCVSGTECFRYYKNTFIGRLTKCFVNIRDNQFFVFHKSVHSLSYHTKTFLDRFFKSTTDSHYFTDWFHWRTQFFVYPMEFTQVPTRNFTDHIIQSRLEEGGGRFCYGIFQIEKSVTQS